MRKHNSSKEPLQGKQLCVPITKIHGQYLICSDKRKNQTFQIPLPKNATIPKSGSVWISVGKRISKHAYQATLLGLPTKATLKTLEQNLIQSFALENHFPHEIEQEVILARNTDETNPPRINLCNELFITMDGADARDFDDAISIAKNGENWRLLVAIADVTHRVPFAKNRKRVSLDYEAFLRGNSFYFPTSVCPMFPQEISNTLCSLIPNQKRLVLVCECILAKDGEILSSSFFPATICSAMRCTYEDFERYFIQKDSLMHFLQNPMGQAVYTMLNQALELSEILRTKRMREGSLLIPSLEASYTIDAKGNLSDIGYRKQHAGHKLIEECMLVANETCAKFLKKKDLPFLSRIHPYPDPEKLKNLESLLRIIAPHRIKRNQTLTSSDLPSLMHKEEGSHLEKILSRLCLRCLAKAQYSQTSERHFGLAKDDYCHFTSPIRRYADITVHRALKFALNLSKEPILSNKRLDYVADHINKQEQKAQELEREIQKHMACLFLANHIGKEFSAIVDSISAVGIFVQLEDRPVTGLIPRRFLPMHKLHEHNQRLLYRDGRKAFQIGDPVRVKLISTNQEKGFLTFILCA